MCFEVVTVGTSGNIELVSIGSKAYGDIVQL